MNQSIEKIGPYNSSYIHLSRGRIIFLTEIITKLTAAQLSALLLYYDHKSPTEEIVIYIDSPGGDAAALFNIYDVMNIIKAPITTICMGKCYSAGAFILAAGNKRFAMKNSKIMIHGIQSTFPIPGQDMTNSKGYYQHLEANNSSVMKMLAKHTGQSLEKIKEDCLRDKFMSPKEALEYGIIDGII